jgi:perosamine synthetase
VGLEREHAVATTSGTAALFLALHALGAQGRPVAFPAYVCTAVRNAVAFAGGAEQLVDNHAGSPNGDFRAAGAAAIAIVPHTYGIPPRERPPTPFVIADGAQALGARIDDRHAGLAADAAIYSFYATKLITSGGQGGMVVARDRRLADAVRDFLDFDQRTDGVPRFNLHVTDVQSAVGRVQLRRLPAFIERRESIFDRYRSTGVPLLGATPEPGVTPVRYRAVVESAGPQRFIDELAARGVTAIVPFTERELLGDPARFTNARALANRTVSLPLYPALSDPEVETVVAALHSLGESV